VDPLNASFGWTKSEINTALTIGFITWAASAPIVGTALDRYGGKRVMSFGSVIGAVSLLIWAHSSLLYMLYGAWILMGVSMASALYKPAFYVLTMTFPDSYKRVITWLTLAGGFASTIFIPLVELCISTIGWHYSLLAMAACNIVIAFPIHLLKLPDNRAVREEQSGNKKVLDFQLFKENEFKVQTFWGLNLWFVILNSITTGITFLLIPLLSEVGTDQGIIIFSFSMIGPMQVLGRFVLMWFGIAVPLGWLLGILVTLADLVRPKGDGDED
jgi:MFS family permease